MAKAVFGGGCFWCLDAVFRRVKGVNNVVAGYAGGRRPNPSYEQVCTGVTGHAEVVEVEFDENEITYSELLDIFFTIHDPTQLNRQGNDVGTQYRSIILYLNDDQKKEALIKVWQLKKSGTDAVTEIKKLEKFFPAEEYHQNYFAKNPTQPYCVYVVGEKVNKFLKRYNEYSKDKNL
jgi:peptide-methionine (S)-S-oxide reductase